MHRWEVTDTAVYTQTGWWSRERRIAPMSRIQTVDHAEGAIARLFGLATVTVTTASAAGALEIAGLDQTSRARAGRRADDQGGRRRPGDADLSAYPAEPGPSRRRRVAAAGPTDAAGAPDPRGDPLPAGADRLRRWLGPRPDGEQWQLFGVAIPIALGLLRYLTTSFRITGGRIELQRGLFNRHVLSTPVDRVRTVDLTASLIHRMLGLTKVLIGTGTASTTTRTGSTSTDCRWSRARALRGRAAADLAPRTTRWPPSPRRARGACTFDPAWVRFAPLTGSGVVIGAAALGAASQLLQATDFFVRLDPETLDRPGLSLLVLVPLVVLGRS